MNYWMQPPAIWEENDLTVEMREAGFTQIKNANWIYEAPEVTDPLGKAILNLQSHSDEPRLSDVFDYYRSRKGTIDKSSEYGLNTTLKDLNNAELSTIKRDQVIAFADRLRATGLKPSTLNRRVDAVRAAWNMYIIDKERNDLNHNLWKNLNLGASLIIA